MWGPSTRYSRRPYLLILSLQRWPGSSSLLPRAPPLSPLAAASGSPSHIAATPFCCHGLRHHLPLSSVARIDDGYFRSFIDFASSEAVEKEGLVPTDTVIGFPDIFVSNLKGIPMYDLDFGTGRPLLFTRSHPPWEGYVFIMPPMCNDGSMDVQVSLSNRAMDIFKECCYCLEWQVHNYRFGKLIIWLFTFSTY